MRESVAGAAKDRCIVVHHGKFNKTTLLEVESLSFVLDGLDSYLHVMPAENLQGLRASKK